MVPGPAPALELRWKVERGADSIVSAPPDIRFFLHLRINPYIIPPVVSIISRPVRFPAPFLRSPRPGDTIHETPLLHALPPFLCKTIAGMHGSAPKAAATRLRPAQPRHPLPRTGPGRLAAVALVRSRSLPCG